MALSPEDIAAIAAALRGTVPATSAPVIGKAASPFETAAATAAGPASPATVAKALYPGDQGAQRRYIATLMLPGWSCDIDTTAPVDGADVPSALHGYVTHNTTGEPCKSVSGLPRGTACPGKVR